MPSAILTRSKPPMPASIPPRNLGWMMAGLSAMGAYWFDFIPSLSVMVCMFGATTVLALATIRISGFSLLSRLMILLYAAPFTATIGYLFDADYFWWNTPELITLCQDHELNSRMLMIAWVGLFGLVNGMIWCAARFKDPTRAAYKSPRPESLAMCPFLALLILGYLFSWMHAPRETILKAKYASEEQGTSQVIQANFNSANIVSYLILILLYIDVEREIGGSSLRKWKAGLLFGTIGYIIVVLQLLRGDRESAGLIVGLLFLYLTETGRSANLGRLLQSQWRKARKVALPLSLLVAIYYGLGFIRSSVNESGVLERPDSLNTWYSANTWTVVATTNLALTADMTGDDAEYYFGQTYLDYLISLPPGFLTHWLGIERPIERISGPAWWYRYFSGGGVHVAVVPHKNFGIIGVFTILGLYGIGIAYSEMRNATGMVLFRTLYGAIATCSFMWFWYGDLGMIRGLMLVPPLVIMHRLLARPRRMRVDVCRQSVSLIPQPGALCI